MGTLMIVMPFIIYYFVLNYILKKYDETNKRLSRNMLFIILLSLPFWDHIIGYAYYKYLCMTNEGVKISRTVTDKQEQLNYWFWDNTAQGISSESSKTYTDVDKILKTIKKPFSNKVVFRKLLHNKYPTGYFNYCKEEYDNLLSSDPKYSSSCKYTDQLIKKYKLENVIKAPISPYRLYISGFDKNHKSRIVPFLRVTSHIKRIESVKTKEILAINRAYGFRGGWYINLFSPYGFSARCESKIGLTSFEKSVIPNPNDN